MTNLYYLLGIYLLLINVITFIVYGLDKRKAIKRKRRISEATLLTLATIGGSWGALLGMLHFRHKTKHLKFAFGIPLLIVLQNILFILVYCKLTDKL